jgi:hypothetical protein
MAICGEEANGQAVLIDGREIKGDAISLQEAFLEFKRKKQVSDLCIKSQTSSMQGMITESLYFSG